MAKRMTHHRSLFWPLVLIGVGVIWLLGDLGLVSAINLAMLLRLWPLLLIAIGLELLFGRGSPATSAIIGLGTVGLAIVLMLVGPAMGLVSNPEIRAEHFSAPRDDASAARVDLDLSLGTFTITALNDSPNLIEADLTYLGEVDFAVSGEREKVVRLSQTKEVEFNWPFSLLNFPFGNNDQELHWYVSLTPAVPLELNINSGVGDTRLDLGDLQIRELNINGGVGKTDLTLPAQEERYTAYVNGGVGELQITIAENADINLSIHGRVGQVTIDVPDGAAVRLEADGGIGEINAGIGLVRISGDENNLLGDEGIWETPDYRDAARRITIISDGSVGGLTMR